MKDKAKRSPNSPLPKEGAGLLKMNLDPIVNNVRLKANKNLISQIRTARKNNQFVAMVLTDGVQLRPEMVLPLFEVYGVSP